jgi:threonine-phosphate decarboxylase
VAVKEACGHGGNVYAAARDLQRPVGTILDFSASINPLGPSPDVSRSLAAGARLIEHYPDPDCVSLREALASRWKLSPEHFVIGNGSTELIDLIPRALRLRSALIVGPTFSEYADALHRAGVRSHTVFAVRSDGYRPPVEEVTRYVRLRGKTGQPPDSIFLCNPNSPTGQTFGRSELMSIIKKADRLRTWIILDETFVEYCGECSMLPWLSQYPRLILLRSFTKFYALPGLRIGYSVSSPPTAAVLRQFQPPWSVNTLAQRAAEMAIRDHVHTRRSLKYLRLERERLVGKLSSLSGLVLFPSRANFLLLELPKPHRAGVVTAELRRQGLLIRDCSRVPGLTTRTIRVAIRARSENDRLIASFAKIFR